MSGSGQDGKKPAQRLGTLSANGDLPAGRLGALRMTSAAEASTSQQGQPAAVARKGKFKPTVVARKKKEDTLGTSAAASAANEDAFKDLIKLAQSDAAWQKGGRGRGRGRGRQNVSYHVAFGGGGGQSGVPTSFRPKSEGGFGAGSSDGRKRLVKAGDLASTSGAIAGVKPELELFANGSGRQKVKKHEGALDYKQYYPTMLPLRPPDLEDAEEPSEDAAPPDLLTKPEDPGNVAERLGLLNTDEHSEQLMLFQLPPLLPIPVPPEQSVVKAESGRPRTVRTDTPTTAPALELKQLPSGKIGKLLVFESGKVKMQLGEVLLDVAPGMPCHFRQDLTAINVKAGHCVFMGEAKQRVVCSPDIEQLLSDAPVPKYQRVEPEAAGNDMAIVPSTTEVKHEADGPTDMHIDVKTEPENGHIQQPALRLGHSRRLLVPDEDMAQPSGVQENGAAH